MKRILNEIKKVYFCLSLIIFFAMLYVLNTNTYAIGNYSVSIKHNHGDYFKNIDAKVTPAGRIFIVPQTVIVDSNYPSGVKLFLSSKDENIVPRREGTNSENLTPISPVTGTMNEPSVLNVNSFGFAMPKKEENPLSVKFSEDHIYNSSDREVQNTAKFSRLGNKNELTEIYRSNGVLDKKHIKLYYGVKLNNTVNNGKYSIDMIYTVIPNLAGDGTNYEDLNNNPRIINEDDNKDIELQYNETVSNKNIGIFTSVRTNINILNSDVEVKINDKVCSNLYVDKNSSLLDGNYINSLKWEIYERFPLRIKCVTPENSLGKYDLSLKIVKNGRVLLNLIKKNAVEYVNVSSMQDFGYQQCEQLGEHEIRNLQDNRDGEIYSVTKLRDGKCWMVDNLRLKLSNQTQLTSENTDIVDKWTPSYSTEVFNSDGVGTRWANRNIPGSGYLKDKYKYYGVYYSHTAATAGTSAGLTEKGAKATSSICPKGWRLPNYSENHEENELYNLAKAYRGESKYGRTYIVDEGGATEFVPMEEWSVEGGFVGDNNMAEIFPGFDYGSGHYNRYDNRGQISKSGFMIWSSSVKDRRDGYAIHDGIYSGEGLSPHGGNDLMDGVNVRCVVSEEKSNNSNIKYMQDFTLEMCDKMIKHQTETLVDKRDGQQYVIAKLEDNKCWMNQNLRLKLSNSKALTSQDTDIENDWTPPESTAVFTGNSGSSWGSNQKAIKSSYREVDYLTVGVYYSHSAAVAGTAENLTQTNSISPGSICPKGWKLPDSGNSNESGEYFAMMRPYSAGWRDGWYFDGQHRMSGEVPNFQTLGYIDHGGVLNHYQARGYWWTSNVNGNNSAYHAYMAGGYVVPRYLNARLYGFNLRCLKR